MKIVENVIATKEEYKEVAEAAAKNDIWRYNYLLKKYFNTCVHYRVTVFYWDEIVNLLGWTGLNDSGDLFQFHSKEYMKENG